MWWAQWLHLGGLGQLGRKRVQWRGWHEGPLHKGPRHEGPDGRVPDTRVPDTRVPCTSVPHTWVQLPVSGCCAVLTRGSVVTSSKPLI